MLNANISTEKIATSLRMDLVAALGAAGVVDDAAKLSAHAGDWSEAPVHNPSLLILPRNPQEVAAVLAICSRHAQPVVVQGGLTGLAGGATPMGNEVALSLDRLNQIEDIDAMGGTAVVQAGVVLEELQRRVEQHDWCFPLDLGARGSCQVGGNAATNAGGNRVIRYGTMRDLVLGIEVALPDGRLLTMLNRVTKNTTGIDLKHLFIGSEGTLGVITRLVLKLSPKPTTSSTALCALPSFDAATTLLHILRRDIPSLSAFEVMWSDYMEEAQHTLKLKRPFEQTFPVYALLETLGSDAGVDRDQLEGVLGRAIEGGIVGDVVVAQSLDHASRLWNYREAVGEILSFMKPFAAFDVGIPTTGMAKFVDSVQQELESHFPEQRHLFFGHLGDGNLHVLSGPHENANKLHEVESLVYAAVSRAGGSISAEHGIGVVKKEFLGFTRTEEEIGVMRDLKSLFDPMGILNSGRILDSPRA